MLASLPLLLTCVLFAQDTDSLHPITAEGVREHIEVLASDSLEGRLAGTSAEQRAAEYIRTRLEEIEGLRPGGPDGTWFQEFTFPRWLARKTSHNVLAVLPGSDPSLARQTIVIGAHYDHEGPGGGAIYNGADDNASGSAVLLELAAALAARPERPRHTLLFQWYGAEESGLLGSAHYVDHPVRPLRDTVMMLNLDMVGRLRGHTLAVGGTGTSPIFPVLLSGLCRRQGVIMKKDSQVAPNSDHWSFFKRAVPVIYFFTGYHDDYHKVSDETSRINMEGAALVGQIAESLVLAIDALDAEERPAFTSAPRGNEHWTPRPWVGVQFKRPPSGGRDGLVVAGVDAAGPGDRAGLRAGDVVTEVAGQPVCVPDGSIWRLLPMTAFEPAPCVVRVLRTTDAEAAPETLDLPVLPEIR